MMRLTVISPEKKILETEVISVTVPTAQGEITILPGHMAIFSLVEPGEITARTQDGALFLAGGSGFVHVSGDKVVILLEYGVRGDHLNEEIIREAKHRAEESLKTPGDENSQALARAALARSLLELKVIQKRKAKT